MNGYWMNWLLEYKKKKQPFGISVKEFILGKIRFHIRMYKNPLHKKKKKNSFRWHIKILNERVTNRNSFVCLSEVARNTTEQHTFHINFT